LFKQLALTHFANYLLFHFLSPRLVKNPLIAIR